MRRAKVILAAAAASALIGNVALATDYTWQNFASGTYSWTVAGNWSPAGVPSVTGDTADISGAVTGGNLNIALPSNVSVSTLTLGATGALATIDIGNGNSGGGVMTWANSGTTLVTMNSLGSAGSTNVISSPIVLGDGTTNLLNFQVNGTAPVNFAGGLTVFMDNAGTSARVRTLTLRNGTYTTGTMTSGTVTLNLGTLLVGTTVMGPIQLAQPGALQAGSLLINSAIVNSTGADPLPTPNYTYVHGGTVIFNGVISNGGINNGRLTLGVSNNPPNFATVPTTYVFNVDNTYSGQTTLGRGDYMLTTAAPFGTGLIAENASANSYGVRFIGDSDSRVLPNNIQVQQNLTFAGTHSLTTTGNWFQSNARDVTNLLPADKTLNIRGFVAVTTGSDGSTEGEGRRLQFDGTGVTVVNGPIYNHRKPWFGPGSFNDLNDETLSSAPLAIGSVYKKGTGTLILDPTVLPVVSDGAGGTFLGATSTYRGQTRVQGGLVEFASPAGYGRLDNYTAGSFTNYSSAGTARVMVGAGGAVGVRTSSLTQEFVDKLNATFLDTGNVGGLALSSVDAATNIDLSTGSLSGVGVTGMSIGALSSGVTYTGTITPNVAQGYRLGGGGALTLPNANQLTGSRNVTVTNGGKVVVSNTNNYTGRTTVRGDYLETAEVLAQTSAGTNNVGGGYAVRMASTLAVSSLADGGSPSSIGSSSNAASNLVLNGATLQYAGAGSSTDRLFTMNPVGATLDSSGSGAVNFTSTGAIVQVDAPSRTGNLTSGNRVVSLVGDVSDLAPGMSVTIDVAGVGTFIPGGVTLLGMNTTWGGALTGTGSINGNIAMSSNATAAATGAVLTFTNQHRNLTLTGSNAGANTLAAQLTNSAAGRLGIVKNGSGAWNVTGANNTFTNGVTVNAGVLSVKKLVGNGTTTINGGTLKIGPGGPVGDTTATSVFVEGGFSIAGGATPAGKLDLGKNGAIFDYTTTSPKAIVAALLDSAYGTGNWAGNGITSSNAAAAPGSHGVGYAEASDIGSPATFLGQATDATAVLVRYTRSGDANLSGSVELSDFTRLAAAFGGAGEWSKGDFNYDGLVTLGDFTILAANFGQVATGDLPRGSAVPEPATLGLLSAASLLMGRRRRM